jgi:large subunit ribosomal protein L25
MAKQYKLTVEKREVLSNKDLKSLRKDFKIPGVYYSYDGNNILFQISQKEIKNAIQSGANIFTVNVGGNEQNVIFKSVQYHPVTEQIIHIDLYGVNMNKSISIKIPITYLGNPLGVTSEGGVLITNLNEIEILCLPSDIPDNIEVDISEVALGENIQAGDVDLDQKFELVTMSDTPLMSVTHAAVEEEPVIEEESAEGDEIEEGSEGSDSSDSEQSADSENKEGSDS